MVIEVSWCSLGIPDRIQDTNWHHPLPFGLWKILSSSGRVGAQDLLGDQDLKFWSSGRRRKEAPSTQWAWWVDIAGIWEFLSLQGEDQEMAWQAPCQEEVWRMRHGSPIQLEIEIISGQTAFSLVGTLLSDQGPNKWSGISVEWIYLHIHSQWVAGSSHI